MTDIGCPPPWTRHTTGLLAELLADFTYQPGWTFTLWQHNDEIVLAVDLDTDDTYTGQPTRIGHRFLICATTDRVTWRRWLLDRILDVHKHEACEWFMEGTIRPFDPHHHYTQHAYQIHDWTQT